MMPIRRTVATIVTVTRQCTYLLVGAICLLEQRPAGSAQCWFLALLTGWAAYRLLTRSLEPLPILIDYGWAIGTAAAIPILVTGPQLQAGISAPQAVVGIAVATLAVQLPPRWSVPAIVGALAVYVAGAVRLIGWPALHQLDDLYALSMGAMAGAAARQAVWRMSATVEKAHRDRLATEVANTVAAARRDHEREQLALLHDTAAATLMLVGQDAALPPQQLAARAARDLQVLRSGGQMGVRQLTDVVPALHRSAAHLDIPVTFSGRPELRIDGDIAAALGAAVREALNNAERHSRASLITVEVADDRIEVRDNGIGFDRGASAGHGITESIAGRMRRAGGRAEFQSAPGDGTVVRLSWRADALPSGATAADTCADALELMRRFRTSYGWVLVGLAIVQLLIAFPWSLGLVDNQAGQVLLALTAAGCAFAAVPGILRDRWLFTGVAMAVLAVVAVVAPALLDADQLGTQAAWSQTSIGFCLLPLLLRWPSLRAIAMLLAYWFVPLAISLAREPTRAMVISSSLCIATYLVAQIALASFNSIWIGAARDTAIDHRRQLELLAAESVATAVQTQHFDRYAETIERLRPLLEEISSGAPLTDRLRQRARAESQRLRMLFDESDKGNQVLTDRIHALVRDAESRRIDVTVHLDPDLPALSRPSTTELLDRIETQLTRARSWARVVLSADSDGLEVSVLCDTRDGAPHPIDDTSLVITDDDTLWVTFRVPARC